MKEISIHNNSIENKELDVDYCLGNVKFNNYLFKIKIIPKHIYGHLIILNSKFNSFLDKNIKYVKGKIQLLATDVNTLENIPYTESGVFYLSNNNIYSVKGIQENVKSLNLSDNILTSLEHFPKYVKYLNVDNNDITNFKNCSLESCESLLISKNGLESLEGMPKVTKDFYAINNKLTDLKGIKCGNVINLNNNYIQSLEGIDTCKRLIIRNNKITNLKNVHICKEINLLGNEIEYLEVVDNCEKIHIDTDYIKNLFNYRKNISFGSIYNNINFDELINFDIQSVYVMSDDYKITDNEHSYFENLLTYLIINKKNLKCINWPKDFFNSLSEEVDNLYNSDKGISKFDL